MSLSFFLVSAALSPASCGFLRTQDEMLDAGHSSSPGPSCSKPGRSLSPGHPSSCHWLGWLNTHYVSHFSCFPLFHVANVELYTQDPSVIHRALILSQCMVSSSVLCFWTQTHMAPCPCHCAAQCPAFSFPTCSFMAELQ